MNSLAGHLVKYGKHRTRRSYSRIKEVLELPNLIEIQTDSYNWFMEKGLREMFDDIMPIDDFQGKLSLEFVDYQLLEPKYTVDEAREHDANYSAPLHVTLRLTNHETGEIKSQDVFFGDFPLMTDQGTFIINGAERVIVSQLVRSPGVYYSEENVEQYGEYYNLPLPKTDAEMPEGQPNVEELMTLAEETGIFTITDQAFPTEVADVLFNAQDAIANGQMTPEEGAENIQSAIEAYNSK